MAKSGLDNPQTTEIIPFGVDRRLRPPDSLPDDARRAFVDLVSSVPAAHFKPADLPLVCRWCELVALAERAAFELSQAVVTPDNKLSAWFTVHASTTKSLNALALRLRLGPQSRALKQSKKEPAMLSAYDRMRMEKNWDSP
jgi:hypothetical protein